ncbi:MAG: hypothetical protein MMC33_002374 [Icmadophila ericetorum]|nr:hypothetical protein [Icmadophila ericetorum]
MLRRSPTSISLIPDDIAAYELRLAQRIQLRSKQLAAQLAAENGSSSQETSGSYGTEIRHQHNGEGRAQGGGPSGPNGEFVENTGSPAQAMKTRERERIMGVGR